MARTPATDVELVEDPSFFLGRDRCSVVVRNNTVFTATVVAEVRVDGKGVVVAGSLYWAIVHDEKWN